MSPNGDLQKPDRNTRRKNRNGGWPQLDSDIRRRFGAWLTNERAKLGLSEKSFQKPCAKTIRHAEAGSRLTRTTFVKILSVLNEEGTKQGIGSYESSWELIQKGVLPQFVEARTVSGPEKRMFADYLTGLAFAEWKGSREQWDFAFKTARERLLQNPDDFFVRAMVLWSVLLKGKPCEILSVVQDLSKYLATESRSGDAADFGAAWRGKLKELRKGTIEAPRYVQRHFEDTVTRALLLRWMKCEGNSTSLTTRIKSISNASRTPFEIDSILDSTKLQSEKDWLEEAIQEVEHWVSREPDYGLAQLFRLFLTGRRESREGVAEMVEQACRWIDLHPESNDPLIRWGTMWIAGMLGDFHVDQVYQQSRRWLNSPVSRDDRVLRFAHLWLTGCRGTRNHIESAIADTRKWLKQAGFRRDDSIHSAYLLCLIRRGQRRGMVSGKEVKKALEETQEWGRRRNDELVQLAWTLAESPVECD